MFVSIWTSNSLPSENSLEPAPFATLPDPLAKCEEEKWHRN